MPTSPSSRIAYVMSWFPAVTETFILNEMLELRRRGADLEIYPLFGASQDVRHPGSDELAPLVQYHRALSVELLAAQLHWLRRRPLAYLGAWRKAIAGNIRSPEFLAKAMVVVPRAAVLARRMEERGIAHVHAHWATHPALAAFIVRELTGIGYSFTAHAHDLYLDRSMLGQKIAAASLVVTISRFNRALIERVFGAAAAAKTVVIPCGVDVGTFAPRHRTANGALRIACVAGLRDYKGHAWLVEACRLLAARGVPFELSLVGDGPERKALEAQVASAGLQDRVTLLGNRPHGEVKALLDASDVMVMPSVTTPAGMMDGIPVALMEAMAAGMPVVSTRVSGIPELVKDGETGLLAPEKDAAALADALERLHREPELGRRLAEAARQHVVESYNLGKNSAQVLAQIRAAMAKGGGEPEEVPTRAARLA